MCTARARMPASLLLISAHACRSIRRSIRSVKPARAPDRRAQARTTEQVVGHAVAARPAGFADNELARVQRRDVVAGTGIVQIQHPAGERLVEEARAPAERTRGLRSYPGFQVGGLDCPEGGDQHAEVDRFMAQREPEMCHDRLLRGILPGILFHDSRVHLGAACHDATLDCRWRDRQVQLTPEARLRGSGAFCSVRWAGSGGNTKNGTSRTSRAGG